MKFLVTGLGSIGQRHVRNLREILGDAADILAYRARGLKMVLHEDMSAESGVSPESRYNIRIFNTLDAALAEHPDVVLVTNPTNLHIPTALAAAREGCNFFIEKPLSDTLGGVKELLALTHKKGLVAMVGYQLRFHPALKIIQHLIFEERIGPLISVRAQFGDYLPAAHPYEDYRQGYAARKDLGGGVILSLIHELDYVYWLFGMPKRVFALGGKLSSLQIDVEDTASILMECKQNGQNVPVHVHLDFVQRPPVRTCEIIGDKGKIFWDYYANELRIFGAESGKWEVKVFRDFKRNQMFLEEMRHYLRCINREEEPVVDLVSGIGSLKIALAAKQSLETGRIQEIT